MISDHSEAVIRHFKDGDAVARYAETAPLSVPGYADLHRDMLD